MLNKQKFLSSTILYSIGEIVPRVLAFLLLPILTTYLTTYEYGINSYTNALMSFVFVIASLSLNTYLLKFYYDDNNFEERKRMVGSIFYFILLFNILILFLQVLIFPPLIAFFDIDIPFQPYFFLAIINNFFDVISIIPLVVYRVKEDAKGFIIISLSRTILQYVLVVIFVVYLGQGLVGSYYGRLIGNIPFLFIYIYYIQKEGAFRIDFGIIKRALKFSLPLLPGSISYILISLSDRVILERYISLDQIGIYSVAFTLALALNIVIQAVYKTIEPILFKEYYGENFQSTNLILFKIYLFLLLIAAFSVALFSKEIFLIATSELFLIGYKIVPFLIISVVLSGINTYLDILLIAEKRQKVVSYTTILSGVISIAINFLLIPYLGYYGAIIASITAFLVVNIICHLNLNLKRRFIFAQVLLIFLVAFVPHIYDDYISITDDVFLNVFLKLLILSIFIGITMKLLNMNPKRLIAQYKKIK